MVMKYIPTMPQLHWQLLLLLTGDPGENILNP
jgi:hypothetical protein